MINYLNLFLPFFRYGIVGFISACIYMIIIWLLFSLMALHYLLAVGIAYVICNIFHYYGNKKFTFQVRNGIPSRNFIRYLLMILFNYILTLSIVYTMNEYFNVSPYLGAASSIIVTLAIGYLFANKYVFVK